MARYRHYKNFAEPGDTCYITTAVLDCVYVFTEPRIADLMTQELFTRHETYGAKLHAFVVMGHHIHLISQMPST